MKVQNIEDEIRSYANYAGLRASCKTSPQTGEQDCSRSWWFRNNKNELQSNEQGLNDEDALRWVAKEWKYRESLIDSIEVRYDLADYLPAGIKLDDNAVYEIQCAILDNVNWSVKDDSKMIENDIREYVKELLDELKIPPA